MIFSPQPGKQSAVRETVRGQMTLGDHVANESHSLCVGTLSHARRILQSHHIGSFSSHHPPLSTSIIIINVKVIETVRSNSNRLSVIEPMPGY